MRKALLLLLLPSLACTAEPESPIAPRPEPAGELSPAAGTDWVPGRLLVGFRRGAPSDALLRENGAQFRENLPLETKLLTVPPGREKEIADRLMRSGWVEFAEPDYIRTFEIPCEGPNGTCSPPGDTFFGYKWDLHNDGSITDSRDEDVASTGAVDADVDWLEAFDQLGDFQGHAVIGIIDTGILASHDEHAGRVLAQYDFWDEDPIAQDEDGHGTHVAGIAAAPADGIGVPGVAYGPNVKLVVARVCGPTFCSTSAIAKGIRWAVEEGANVLNLSLGGPTGSTLERRMLKFARHHDVLPFCAAGNDGIGVVSYPAAFPECVAVSATGWSDGLASYSSFGPEVDLSAPGGDYENPNGYSYILSSWASGNDDYAFLVGTSMATPQATGLGALLHAIGITDDDAKLERMRDTVDDLGAPGWDSQFGHGRINVFAAVNGVAPPPPPPPPPSDIVLEASLVSRRGQDFASLEWTGTTAAMVDIYRDDELVAKVQDRGVYRESVSGPAGTTIVYVVCEAESTTACSNEASVTL